MNIFYEKDISKGVKTLSPEESTHCSQVLRQKVDDKILIFDGTGAKYHCKLTKVAKKSCEFEITETEQATKKPFSIHLAIAPTKSTDRMEWMIEKLCEIGVDEITFIETHHSERRKLRLDRIERKVVGAMKQSGNPFMMKVNSFVSLNDLIKRNISEEKWIAHVDHKHKHLSNQSSNSKSTLILIGPEGDFSKEELSFAIDNGYTPISLGKNTLRTETAGFVACCMINSKNEY